MGKKGSVVKEEGLRVGKGKGWWERVKVGKGQRVVGKGGKVKGG